MIKDKKIFILTILLISLFTFVFAEETKAPVKKEINLEDGYYKIPIKLWHAIEEKESMGNKAVNQIAELEVKDKKANLYMGSDKMEYMSITASLINIYFQKEDGYYYPAERGDFELEVPKEKDKRPVVFMTPLVNMDEMTLVFVDPKVEPMGDEPIRARIKLDFSKVEKIKEEDATLIHKFKSGPKEPEFKSEESGEVQNKNLIIKYEPNTFAEEFTFYGNKLSGAEAENYSKNFDKLDQVNVFKIEFLGGLEKITGQDESIQATRKKIVPQKDFTLKLPLLKFKKEDKLELYDMTSGEKKKLEFKIDGEHLETTAKKPGVYLVVKSQGANITSGNSSISNNSTVNNTASTKTERAKSFMSTVKKPKSKSISKTSGNNSTPSTLQTPVTSTSPVTTSGGSPLQKQMALAKQGAKNTPNTPNTTSEKTEEVEEIKEKESKGIIFFIILIFILLNGAAAVFIKKNFNSIKDMKDEIIFLGGLKKNEK